MPVKAFCLNSPCMPSGAHAPPVKTYLKAILSSKFITKYNID